MNGPDPASDQWVTSIADLIDTDKVEGALAAIKTRAKSGPGELADRVGNQSSRLTRNTREMNEGDISREEALRVRRQIGTALLGLARELDAASAPPVGPNAAEVVSNAAILAALRQIKDGMTKEAANPSKTLEAVHGVNNLKSISWIELGLRASRSVCRILVSTLNGTSYGTGFLIGSGRVMTNNHVISSKEEAKRATIEFNYQLSADASAVEPTVRYTLDPDAFFHTSPSGELDYSVIAVRPDKDKPPLEKWGRLLLNADAPPIRAERVAIIEHPNAQVKQVVLTSSVVVETKDQFARYTSDTMAGSSGSPVFNDLWQVVAIHHAAGPMIGGIATNEGILMSSIRPHLLKGGGWPPGPLEDAVAKYKRHVDAVWRGGTDENGNVLVDKDGKPLGQWVETETHPDFKDVSERPE